MYNGGYTLGFAGALNPIGDTDTAVSLDGSSGYLSLPSGLVEGATGFTWEGWVYFRGGTSWQRLFDFGNTDSSGTGDDYMCLTANSTGGAGGPYFAITTGDNYYAEQTVAASTTLPTDSWQYVALTLDGSTASLYLNGQLSASAAVSLTPASLGLIVHSYLGRSSYSADPYLNGALDEVAIYNYPLSASAIAAHWEAAQQLPANTSSPVITTGTPLSASAGTWSGAPTNYSYQWQRNTGTGWANISGATRNVYFPTAADVGTTLRVAVTGTNDAGSATAQSQPTSPVTPTDVGSYSTAVLNDNPTAYYRLSESSGTTAYDASGNGNDAVVSGAPSLGGSGPLLSSTSDDAAYGFNGGSSALTPLLQTPSSLSIEVWAKTSVTPGDPNGTQLVNADTVDGSARDWQLRIDPNNRVHFIPFLGGAPLGLNSTTDVVDGRWHYIAAVVSYNAGTNTSTARLYVDGTLEDAAYATGALPPSAHVGIGYADSMTGGWSFNGDLAEVALYPSALTASDIANRYYLATGQPPAPSTFGAPRDGNGTNVNDPVNIATGNVYTSVQDMEVPGRGPSALWLRTYNSEDAETGPYGYGWTTDFTTSLSPNGDGSVTERDPGGAQLLFAPNGSGGYTPPAGVLDTLAQNSNGTYTLTKPNGVAWNFSSSGQLQSIVDLDGNALQFSYTNGLLSSITNASGRSITLTYYGSGPNQGYLQSITDGPQTVYYGYDSAGNLTSVTDPDGGVTTYQYDDAHHLTDIISPSGEDPGVTAPSGYTLPSEPGQDMHFTYDDQGRASSSYAENDTSTGHNDAYYASFQYNTPAAGQTTVTDARGNQTVYSYDSNGDVTSILDPNGHTQSWTWSGGLKSSYTNQSDQTTYYYYDGKGNLTEVKQPAPQPGGNPLITTYSYGAYDEMTEKDAPGDVITKWSYYPDGNVETYTDPDNNVTSYAYNSYGDLTSKTTPQTQGGPSNTTWTYNPDPTTGNLNSVEDPEGNTTYYWYDSIGRRTITQLPRGETITDTLDATGNPTVVTYSPAGSGLSPSSENTQHTSISNVYDARGNLIFTTNQSGNTTSYTYTPQDKVATKTDAEGRTTAYAYDAQQNITSLTDPAGNVTQYVYDPVEQLTSVTKGYGSADASTTSTGYYPDGQVETVTGPPTAAAPNGATTTYYYDQDGRLTSVKDANNVTTSYQYWPTGYLESVTDPNNNTTSYTEDSAGNVVSKTDAMNQNTWSYTYVGGELATSKDPQGQETDYTYTADDQLSTKSFPGSSWPTLYWYYTPDGKLDHTIDGTGTTQYSYNQLDELTQTVLPGSRQLNYTYNPDGTLASEQLPGESTATTYAYWPDGSMKTATDPVGNQTSFTYNSDGLLQEVAYPSGAAEQYSYDPLSRVSSVENDAGNGLGGQGSVISKLTYGYDAASNVTSITDQNSAQATFSYDALNRLTSENYPAGFAVSGAPAANQSYTYYPAGNRETLTNNLTGETTTYSYNADEELTGSTDSASSANNMTYDYNADGQMSSEQQGSQSPVAFSYDPVGNLTQAGSDTYAYNIDGQRVSETVGGQTTTQTFDQAGNFVQQADGSGNATSYLYGADGLVSATDPSGNVSYYGHDALGSVIALTSGFTGSATDQYAWDAFGENLAHSGSSGQPFGFMGNQTDPTTGLDNFNAREYDPTTGQFLSMDPVTANLQDPQSINRYDYGTDNPFGNPDPTGLCGASSVGQLLNSINPLSSQNCAYQAAQDIKNDTVNGAEGMYNSAPGALNELADSANYYLQLGISELNEDGQALAKLGVWVWQNRAAVADLAGAAACTFASAGACGAFALAELAIAIQKNYASHDDHIDNGQLLQSIGTTAVGSIPGIGLELKGPTELANASRVLRWVAKSYPAVTSELLSRAADTGKP